MLDGPRQTADLARARELRPLYDRADYLLDLHSMTDPCPPLALAGRQHKGSSSRRRSASPEHIIVDAGHAAGKRLRDYAFFDDSGGSAQRAADRMRPALGARRARRREAGRRCASCAISAWSSRRSSTRISSRCRCRAQKVIEVTGAVTIATDEFAFARSGRAGSPSCPRRARCSRATATPRSVTPYDDCVLIMPTRRPKKGETAVRLGRFVA